MLKLIKWDLRNVWEISKSFIIITAIMLLVSLVFPINFLNIYFPNISDISGYWAIITSTILVIYFVVGIVYAIIKMLYDFRNNQLHLTVDKKSYQIILSKVIVNILLTCIIMLGIFLGEIILKRFSTENSSFFTVNFNKSIIEIILSTTYTSVLLLTCYIISKSYKGSRNIAFINMVILIILIATLVGVGNIALQYFCGANIEIYYRDILGFSVDTNNMNMTLYNNLYLVCQVMLIGIYVWMSSKLLDKKYER